MISDVLTEWLKERFAAILPGMAAEVRERVQSAPATNMEFGDYQCNDAMTFAKQVKRPPRALAEEVAAGDARPDFIAELSVAGPGFLNIRLADSWLCAQLEALAADSRLGIPDRGNGRTVLLDYSSPNVAKPMHIGHIRSTIIGNALDRIHRALGYRVLADNHLGDWGTQFGILILGYRNFVDPAALRENPIAELERVYVKSYDCSRQDPAWLDRCREELVKLQAGDPDNRALWEQFVAYSMAEFDRVYRRLGVQFDLVRGESYYRDDLAGVVAELEAKGLARESEGATVVFLEEEKLPVCIVRKRDGAFNYATTDLATLASRVREFNPDQIIYVTDERQQLHFRQFFAVARRLGCTARVTHVWFGLMRLPEGTFSTRQGNVIKLERLLDEAETRALEVVKRGGSEAPPEVQQEIARVVGIGAVKYADLSQNPQTTVTFSWDKALALEGNSAPYLLYAYARIASVRDKYAERFPAGDLSRWPIRLTEPLERELAVRVLQFPEAVVRAADLCRPSAIADYLYDLAQTYSRFYQNVPFLKAEEGVRESRVRLCGLVADVLRRGLELLGIETLERI